MYTLHIGTQNQSVCLACNCTQTLDIYTSQACTHIHSQHCTDVCKDQMYASPSCTTHQGINMYT